MKALDVRAVDRRLREFGGAQHYADDAPFGAQVKRRSDRRAVKVRLDQQHLAPGARKGGGETDRAGRLPFGGGGARDQERTRHLAVAAGDGRGRAQSPKLVDRVGRELLPAERTVVVRALFWDSGQDGKPVAGPQLLLSSQTRIESLCGSRRRSRCRALGLAKSAKPIVRTGRGQEAEVGGCAGFSLTVGSPLTLRLSSCATSAPRACADTLVGEDFASRARSAGSTASIRLRRAHYAPRSLRPRTRWRDPQRSRPSAGSRSPR